MLKWIKIEDEYLTDVYYSLKDENEQEVAYIWYDYFANKWFLTPTIFNEFVSKKVYSGYNVNDVEKIKFMAMLDLQADFNNIIYKCNSIGEEIDNYILKHLEKEMHNNNEDK